MKSLYKFALPVVIIALAGCSDSNVPASYHASLSGHSLNISKNQLSFESNGGVENVTVQANNVAWRFSGLPEWLNASPMSGSSTSSVSFTASENLATDTARTAMFYLESADAGWSYKTMVSATQKAATSYITPATTTLTFQGSGGSQTINVISNVEWKATTSASWAKAEASADGKSLNVSVDENPSDASRSAIITLSSTNGITASVNITQEPAGVEGTTETLEFEKEGGSKTISITADAAWEIKTSDSWITVEPSAGEAGSHTLSITTSENNSTSDRNGYVYVNIGGSSKLQVPIVQKGLYIEVSPAALRFSADEETNQLEIKSNTDWSITSIPDWLTTSTMTGNNTQTISLTAQSNTSASSRSGKIKIEKEGMTLSATVDVQQDGLDLSVDYTSLQFDDKASTQEVVINTISSWAASSSEGWINLSQTSGTGKSTLSITVDENMEDGSRTGSVKIVAGELNQTITITQQGKYFNISETDKTFTSKGGTLQISFSTNNSWTATASDASWLTLSSTSGSGDAVIDITASDNASMKARECVVTITPSSGQGAKVNVKQEGRYLRVNTTNVTFPHEGGSSDIIYVDTDGSYEITTNENWLSINTINSNSFTIVADQNEGSNRTGTVYVALTQLSNGEVYSIDIDVQQSMNTDGFVDLGLPSGTMWSSCNVGANSPLEMGERCYWDSQIENGRARIPSKEEVEELISNCSLSWQDYPHSDTMMKSILVATFKGRNGKSISIPFRFWGGYAQQAYYWTSTPHYLEETVYSFHDGWPDTIYIGSSSLTYSSGTKRTEIFVRPVLNK